ncbi:MAG: AI-2E family transporter [Bacteroidetes bacterium]|nr:AI-2E family transporter [Bacteroidota bacterium]MCL2301700.1 AI-2E family transporter [Lentimicrobiaceae bacterium]
MNNKNLFTIIVFLSILIFLGYQFFNVIIFIFLATIFAAVGSPLMQLLQKIKLKNKTVSPSVAAGITLFLLVGVLSLGFYFLIPFVINELSIVSSIDPTLYTTAIESWLQQADSFLHKHGFLSQNEHLSDILLAQMKSFTGSISISSVVENIISFAGAAFILVFSVVFLTFFALKDKEIFFKMIRSAIPISFRDNYDRILAQTRVQVVRYFSGLLLDMVILGSIIGIACYFAGVPNALLIGVLAGLFDIIPYVGPFIAMGVGLIISFTSLLPTDPSTVELSMLFWKMVIIFVVAKGIDNFVLQPIIFGKSIQAHPVEIFIVILVAGYVGGVTGMIIAVPAYSLFRIVVKEFFGNYYLGDETTIVQPPPDSQKNDHVT